MSRAAGRRLASSTAYTDGCVTQVYVPRRP